MEKNWEDVVTQSNISKKKQSSDIPINRGVELILAEGGIPKSQRVKPFGIRFDKIISILKREMHITFEFSFKFTKKQKSSGEVSCQKR
tara:strand:- start:240 stop:503 length:264 start_codon:yes stop_codon:yes gene_type:complete